MVSSFRKTLSNAFFMYLSSLESCLGRKAEMRENTAPTAPRIPLSLEAIFCKKNKVLL